MALWENAIGYGTHAERPDPGAAGALYFESDTGSGFRDNGASWDAIATAAAGSAGLTVQGGVAANTTLTQGQLLVIVTATGHTITMPPAAGHAGQQIIIRTDDPTKTFTVAAQGIEPAPDYWGLPANNVHYISDGTRWWGID